MVAVLAYSLLQGYPLEEIAKWITAAGTITASKEGTQVCTLQEVKNLAPDIRVQKI
jgi:1-phosphofructokinase